MRNFVYEKESTAKIKPTKNKYAYENELTSVQFLKKKRK